MRWFFLWLLVAGVVMPIWADPEFGPARHYPNIGIGFPVFRHSKSEPLPMPETAALRDIESEAPTAREALHRVFDLWYFDQCCARWRDPQSNRLTIARITRHLPFFEEEFVTRPAFDEYFESDQNRVNPREIDEVDEWVELFAGTKVGGGEKLRLSSFVLEQARYYPCANPSLLIYAFRPRRVGNEVDYDWYCVIYSAAGAVDPQRARREFEESFVERVFVASRAQRSTGVTAAILGGAALDDVHDTTRAVRADARKSIENYGEWWIAETDRHILLADIDQVSGKELIRNLTQALPVLWRAYTTLVPPCGPDQGVAVIRVFRDREDYMAFVGEEMAWTGALWMPKHRELVVVLQDHPEEMMRVLRHESFHQYHSIATGTLLSAAWFNEGHACLFENSRIERGRLVIDEDKARAALVVDNLEQVVKTLPELLSLTYQEFYSGSDTQRRLKYAMAWGLVYYLQKAAPLERQQPYARLVRDYLWHLDLVREGDEATQLLFADLEMPSFQNAFRAFWRSNRNKAERFDPLK